MSTSQEDRDNERNRLYREWRERMRAGAFGDNETVIETTGAVLDFAAMTKPGEYLRAVSDGYGGIHFVTEHALTACPECGRTDGEHDAACLAIS